MNNCNIRTKSRGTVLDKIMTLYRNIRILDLFSHKTEKAIMLLALSMTHRLSSTFVVHVKLFGISRLNKGVFMLCIICTMDIQNFLIWYTMQKLGKEMYVNWNWLWLDKIIRYLTNFPSLFLRRHSTPSSVGRWQRSG